MKQSNTLLVFIIFLFSISVSLLYSSNSSQFSENDNKGIQIISSEYWNLTGTTIFINNSDPSYNWSKIAAENEWCSGSGTWGDPYRIESVTIEGSGTGSCLEIINSYVPFEIKNCVFYNASTGIYLDNVSNGFLLNNTCFNTYLGIDFYRECNNITIAGNILSRNAYGIHLISCNSTHIVKNRIFENRESGIYFEDCIDTTIEENNISKNYGVGGAIVDVGNEKSTYIGNRIEGNLEGIFIGGSSNILVTKNLFLKNTRGALNASFCHLENLAYLNSFVSNGVNAQDKGLSFNWDNSSMGNYWDDYMGKDSDKDGIGDTPYSIQGLPDVPDNYPLMSCLFYSSNDTIISGYSVFALLIGTITIIMIIIKRKNHLS